MKNLEGSTLIFEKINELKPAISLTLALQLESEYLELSYLKLHNLPYKNKLRNLYTGLP